MEEGTRIIKLAGPVNVTSSSFEEAFGEYSEIRGRWRQRLRKRRQERQLQRIRDRAERKRARQAMRAEQQEARQMRKDIRKQRRMARKSMGQEEGGDEEESTSEDSESPSAAPSGEPQGGEPAMGESETTEESDIQAAEEDAMADEESSADGINYEDLGSTEDIVTLEDDDFYSYMDDYASADGKPQMVKAKINPKVKNAAMKAEWNKELATKLKAKIAGGMRMIANLRAMEAKDGKSRAKDIHRYEAWVKNLRIQLNNVLNRALSFDGALDEYSGADDYSEAAGKRGKSVEKRRRAAEVKAARREARKARVKSRKASMKAKSMSRKGLNGDSVIPVDEQLQPEFDTQRIVVPAADLSTGIDGKTGLIALDEANDIDAPAERQIDIKLGADGSKTGAKKINWLGIGIGVAIAGLAIWYGKKKKLF